MQNVPADTTLFTIPRNVIITAETSDLAKKLPRVFDGPVTYDHEEPGPLDSWQCLILVLLYEHLQGAASRWKPYLDLLPHTFDTPLFWTKDELRELDGTCLTAEKVGKKEVDKAIRSVILPIVQQNPTVFYPEHAKRLKTDELTALAYRMGSTIMAYAFDIGTDKDESDSENGPNEDDGWVEDTDGQIMLGMVPMADMLNANAAFNVSSPCMLSRIAHKYRIKAFVNHEEKSLEITTLRRVLAAGQEVLNYYGPLPCSELLRRYGYVTSEHRRYDVVELPWSLVRQALASNFDMRAADLAKIVSRIPLATSLRQG
jgi:SET domain-containing protein 6